MDVNHLRHAATLVVAAASALLGPISVAADDRLDFRVIHPIHGRLSEAPSYFAIRSRKELVAWWNGQESRPQSPPAPAKLNAPPSPATAQSLGDIDFDRYTLIVANAGSKPSSGFGVAITSVLVRDTVSVSVLETVPGVNCPRLTELTHAESFALIPNTKLPIRFFIITATVDCNAHRTAEAKSIGID
jgi:hypothetical protein